MAPRKTQRTVYLVTAAIVVAMVGGYALAATATTTLTNPQGSSQGTTTPGGLIAGYSVDKLGLVVLLAELGFRNLGTLTVPETLARGNPARSHRLRLRDVFSRTTSRHSARPKWRATMPKRLICNGNTRNRCAGKWSRNANRGDL